MKDWRCLTYNFAARACLGLALGASTVAAADQPAARPATQTAAIRILDIELTGTGSLSGTVINAQGNPLAATTVVLRQQRRDVAQTVSDQTGRFQMTGVKPGTYQILAGEGHGLIRLWAEGMAPPSAKPQLMVVAQRGPVVRGQIATISTTALVLGGAAAAGGATGAALLVSNRQNASASATIPVQDLEPVTLNTIGTPVTGVVIDQPVSP